MKTETYDRKTSKNPKLVREDHRKNPWPEGEWSDEPDNVSWVNPASGYECWINRSRLGHLCGYVRIPGQSPICGTFYDNIEMGEYYPHGGLTFSESYKPGDRKASKGIGVWWVGFDCAHLGDVSPGMKSLGCTDYDETYKNIQYVEGETNRLAEELMAATAKKPTKAENKASHEREDVEDH